MWHISEFILDIDLLFIALKPMFGTLNLIFRDFNAKTGYFEVTEETSNRIAEAFHQMREAKEVKPEGNVLESSILLIL